MRTHEMASQTIAVQKEIPTTVRLSEYLKSEKGYAMDGNEILRETKKANLDLDQNSLNFQSLYKYTNIKSFMIQLLFIDH
jgi:hypothetical protein